MTVEIPLTQGKFTIVDDIDADLFGLKWATFNTTGRRTQYAYRGVQKNLKTTNHFIHRVILERKLGRSLRKGEVCDHIDGDGLNNTRDNLRVATYAQNTRNRRVRVGTVSGLKGVTWNKQCKKWVARITVDGKEKHLGSFNSIEDAHAAYREAALKYHGEFANFGTVQS